MKLKNDSRDRPNPAYIRKIATRATAVAAAKVRKLLKIDGQSVEIDKERVEI